MIKRILILTFFLITLSSCRETSDALSGYIEGDYTYISSSLSGTLTKLNVTRGQQVSVAQNLFVLDQQPEFDIMSAAKATHAQNKAGLDLAEIQLERQRVLYTKNATDKSRLDQAETDYESKWQMLLASQSNLYQAIWSLKQKTVNSPVDGSVFDTFFRVGEKVPANTPVLALLTLQNIYVIFFVPEKLLTKIKLGQKIHFKCDSCTTASEATINYVSPQAEYTPPIIYSKDSRERLVYLIRADMPDDIARNFHPGQPVDVLLNS